MRWTTSSCVSRRWSTTVGPLYVHFCNPARYTRCARARSAGADCGRTSSGAMAFLKFESVHKLCDDDARGSRVGGGPRAGITRSEAFRQTSRRWCFRARGSTSRPPRAALDRAANARHPVGALDGRVDARRAAAAARRALSCATVVSLLYHSESHVSPCLQCESRDIR